MARLLYKVIQDHTRVLLETYSMKEALDYIDEAYKEFDKEYICKLTDNGWNLTICHPRTLDIITCIKLEPTNPNSTRGTIFKF